LEGEDTASVILAPEDGDNIDMNAMTGASASAGDENSIFGE
jgi:hypothetical protein